MHVAVTPTELFSYCTPTFIQPRQCMYNAYIDNMHGGEYTSISPLIHCGDDVIRMTIYSYTNVYLARQSFHLARDSESNFLS